MALLSDSMDAAGVIHGDHIGEFAFAKFKKR